MYPGPGQGGLDPRGTTGADDPASGFIQDVRALAIPAASAVSTIGCRYRLAAYRDAHFIALGVHCPNEVKRAVAKRKAEYLAGRHLGALLLLQQGVAASIPTGMHRQPVWPDGWVGSISHTDTRAVSCLAPIDRIALLGIDLERWFDDSTASQVAANLINAREARLLHSFGAWNRALTLVFSAKEALFKAVYPAVGRYFDFDGAELVAVDGRRRLLTFRIAQALSPQVPAGRELHAHYSTLADEVLTLVAC